MLYVERMSSLENAIAILKCLSDDTTELRVTAIAKQLNMPKSTVSRALALLASENILERDDQDRSYRVGFELFRLGNLYKSNQRLIEMMETALREMVREFDVTGYVAVLHGTEVAFLRTLHSASALRFTVERGTTLPAFITALGKSLLARLEPEQLETHLPKQLSYKPLGIDPIPRKDLLAELARIRRNGYAELHDSGYRNAGAVGIALVPQGGSAVSFAVNYPMGLTDDAAVRTLTERLLEHAQAIASQVGDREWFDMLADGG